MKYIELVLYDISLSNFVEDNYGRRILSNMGM